MNLYFAPLEGIGGYIYRNAQADYFEKADKYFSPFLAPNQNRSISPKEYKDIAPEHNEGIYLVPQIMANNAEVFLKAVQELEQLGYQEVNLNLGCPSRTVVTKGRGAGFLDEPQKLDRFLDAVFEKCNLEISIKTRIGMEDPEEFETILPIYNKYPLKELIIHPRVQKEFYKNTPKLDTYAWAVEHSEHPLCYNGDICSVEDMEQLKIRFPQTDTVMMGRGVLANPALGRKLKGGSAATIEELKKFHDVLYAAYCEEMSGDRTILYKMKEMWFYLHPIFTDGRKYFKKIKKCEKCVVYESVVKELFLKETVLGK